MSGLVKVQVEDKNGRLVHRWVKPKSAVAGSNKLLGLAPPQAKKQLTPDEAFNTSLDRIRGRNPDVTLHLRASKNGGYASLDMISIPKESRNSGLGTKIMNEIIELADEQGINLALTPSNEFGSSKTRLEKFYRSFGFVPNKGRNKDFTTRETMIRSAS